MIKRIIIGVVIAVIMIGVFLSVRSQKNRQNFVESQVITSNVHKTINVDATINPDVYADITSEVPTLIKTVDVSVNDTVKRGQKLMTLDKKSIIAQINGAKLAVERAELAERQARRKWDLLKPEERKSIKKATEQSRQKLNEIYAQATKTTIISPIDGIVVEQNARVGEVARGMVMRIIDPESLQVEALIPEVDIAKVSKGDKSFITFDAYPNKVIEGTFISLDTGSTLKQNNTYFKSVIDIDNECNLTILDGMNASVDIEIEKKENVTAVERDFAKKDDKGYFVYILDDNTTHKKQFIKKYFEEGVVGNKFVEVKSGISVGEKIVLPVEK